MDQRTTAKADKKVNIKSSLDAKMYQRNNMIKNKKRVKFQIEISDEDIDDDQDEVVKL